MRMKKIIGGFFCVLFLMVAGIDNVQAQEHLAYEISAKSDISSAILREEDVVEIPKIQDGDLYATAAVLMDADSGRVLYGKNADAPMAMASTTKIMTCILVLEYGNLEDSLQVSSYAASMPKVKLYIKKGETYQVKDLLHSLMLESHNDSAVALAEYIGKQYLSEDLQKKSTSEYTVEESKQAVAAFAALMNQKAAELGCEDTYFITPNGLDATETITSADGEMVQKDHHTTAAELARIMSYCIGESEQKNTFLEITRAGSYSFSANGRSFSCVNHNAFLSMMEGALSGKTGFTNKAGYCYVGALERDGKTFVVALLACGWPNHKTYKWSDTKELMQYGLEHYFFKSFLEEGTAFDEGQLKPIQVVGGQTEVLGDTAYTQIAVEEQIGIQREIQMDGTKQEQSDSSTNKVQYDGLLMRADEQVQVQYNQKEVLEAPVEKGMVVGKVYYVVNDTIYRTENIVTQEDIEKIDLKWCIKQIWERYTF